MATSTAPVRALEIEQLAQRLHAADERLDDPRGNMLELLASVWERGDERRWHAAGSVFTHDEPRQGKLTGEALGLLVQIIDQTEDMITMLGEEPGREDITEEARQLRAATVRLHEIIDAVTAVHLLDD
jgi:hypothetical protein